MSSYLCSSSRLGVQLLGGWTVCLVFVGNIVVFTSHLDDVCDYIVECSNYPLSCSCDETLNCNECDPNTGCNQCDIDYFRISTNNNQQCLLCDFIDNCKFCHLGGCAQCEQDISNNNCGIVKNSCGIDVCSCDDDDINIPTIKITPLPTLAPTAAPTTREDFFNQEIGNVLRGGMTNVFADNAFIKFVFKSYTVEGGPELFDAFFNGICDNGLLDIRKNFIVSTDMKAVTYEMYDACTSSINGLFYINGRTHWEFNDYGKITREVAYFYDETDEDYCLEYANSHT